MTIISIHQPGYLPWLGFFKKILYSDIFVFLDDVKYVKRQWHNRNQIRTSSGANFLTVPIISNSGKLINEMKISYDEDWVQVHKKTMKYNYSKAPYFSTYWKSIEEIYDRKFEYLVDLNMEFIQHILQKFEIKTKTIFSSELSVTKKKSDLNLEICEILKADTYLSGIMGKGYIDEESFIQKNIKVQYQNFQHPTYKQVYDPFIPNMASIDLLFNEGHASSQILQNSKNF